MTDHANIRTMLSSKATSKKEKRKIEKISLKMRASKADYTTFSARASSDERRVNLI